MGDLDKKPDDLPTVTEDVGLPTPPSPGRLPPIHLPPEPEHDVPVEDKDRGQQEG